MYLEVINIMLRLQISNKQPADIDGLQSIPRDSNGKDVAAMLDELTIEANEELLLSSSNMAAMT